MCCETVREGSVLLRSTVAIHLLVFISRRVNTTWRSLQLLIGHGETTLNAIQPAVQL